MAFVTCAREGRDNMPGNAVPGGQKMAFVTHAFAFIVRMFIPVLSCVCCHLYAFMCMLSSVCFHICVLSNCVLSYLCFPMCALRHVCCVCVLLCVRYHMYAFICVLCHVCSEIFVCSYFVPLHCLGSLDGIMLCRC